MADYGIIFTAHAELRLERRQIERAIVISHLRNPEALKLVEKLPADAGDEKYKLWFVPHRRTAYIYIVVINNSQRRIIVKTAVKQRLAWQRRAEKHA